MEWRVKLRQAPSCAIAPMRPVRMVDLVCACRFPSTSCEGDSQLFYGLTSLAATRFKVPIVVDFNRRSEEYILKTGEDFLWWLQKNSMHQHREKNTGCSAGSEPPLMDSLIAIKQKDIGYWRLYAFLGNSGLMPVKCTLSMRLSKAALKMMRSFENGYNEASS